MSTALFGLDRELAEKAASKYDPEREKMVRNWIQDVTGERLTGTMHEALKDGVLLCKLHNKLNPSSPITKINTSTMPFKQMENINAYLKGVSMLGVKDGEMWMTVDLFEAKNMLQVVESFFAVSRCAVAKGFKGPLLGPKLSDSRQVEFTPEQLAAGKGVIGLQMGYTGGANASGVAYGARRDIGAQDPGKMKK